MILRFCSLKIQDSLFGILSLGGLHYPPSTSVQTPTPGTLPQPPALGPTPFLNVLVLTKLGGGPPWDGGEGGVSWDTGSTLLHHGIPCPLHGVQAGFKEWSVECKCLERLTRGDCCVQPLPDSGGKVCEADFL